MLEYKLDINNNRLEVMKLNVTSMRLSGDVIYVTCPNHGLRVGDTVTFRRYEGYVELSEDRTVLSVAGRDVFTIEKLPPYRLYLDYAESVDYKIKPVRGGSPYSESKVVVHFLEPHFFIKEKRFSYINQTIGDDYYTDYTERICEGYNLLYNALVYNVNGGDIMEDGKYNFAANDFMNDRSASIFYYYLNSTYKYTVTGGIVPIKDNALEDRMSVVFPDTANSRRLVSNGGNCEIYAEDTRFYTINGSTVTFTKTIDGTDTSYLTATVGNQRISIPLDMNTDYGFNKEDIFENVLVPSIEEGYINGIVDYEKVVFHPVYKTSDGKFKDISEIVFNIHFRKRLIEDGKKWVTDDTLGWNNYAIDKSGSRLSLKRISGLDDSDADLLSYLDFTDADVYYQRNVLKKSFIRLSVYDDRERNKQSLYNYSTLFYDSSVAYSKYMKARSVDGGVYDGMNDSAAYYVNDEHAVSGDSKDMRLCARFSARPSYDMSASSDGYYMYLFPSVVQGYNEGEMFVRAEFNHSKYGRTVLLTLPTDDDDDVIDATDGDFPVNYMLTSGSTGRYTGVDYKRLEKDIYFKVNVKFDKDSCRYVWYMPDRDLVDHDTGVMTINLFEPRINEYANRASEVQPEKPSTYIGEEGQVSVRFVLPSGFNGVQRTTVMLNGTAVTGLDDIGITSTVTKTGSFMIVGNHGQLSVSVFNTSSKKEYDLTLTSVSGSSADDTILSKATVSPNGYGMLEYSFSISDIISSSKKMDFVLTWK